MEEEEDVIEGNRRFGRYLKSVREARRLTLVDVARLTAGESEPISRSLLSRVENGKASVSALKLLALARTYRVSVGLLAERLEVDVDESALTRESVETWDTEKLLERAAQAGEAGQVHRALVLYEMAEAREAAGASDASARARARLGVCRALYAAGKLRLARDQVEEVLADEMEAPERAWALYFLAKIALDLDQTLLAEAAERALRNTTPPRPDEIEACLPYFEAELLSRGERWPEAVEAWIRALDAARRYAQPAAEARAQLRLAASERARARITQSAEWCARSIATAETHGLSQLKVQALLEEGRIHLARRRKDLARQSWSRAKRLARALDLHRDLFDLYVETWRLAEADDDRELARTALRSLRSLLRFVEYVPLSVGTLRDRLVAPEDPPASEADEEAL